VSDSAVPAGDPGDRMADVRPLRPRSRRRRLRQWPITIVLVGIGIALLVVATDHFRRGAVLLSASVLLAFFLRLLLTDRDAGMLAVRSKRVDLGVLAGLGLALTVFTFLVPPPT
jgi:Protein of unknown function (DUF3017)